MRQSPGGSLAAVVVIAVVAAALAVASTGPAAAQTGGYHDVPSDAYYSAAVSALDAQGVFDGTECAGGGFCPDDPIDRKTMAVWFVRMLDGLDPLLITESRFDDVEAPSFHAPFIERMYHLSVTRGCGDGQDYCPDDSVNRAQMAAFLSRGYQLPAGPDPSFGDVASGAWYAGDLARLVASGITRGCEDGTVFCPDDLTTRGQMAIFLHRAESRNRWVRSEGVTVDGFSYVEFRANANLTELRWRPQGMALVVRCTDEVHESGAITPELNVIAFGYGRLTWFFGDYGVIEYEFGEVGQVWLAYADPTENESALVLHGNEVEWFLDAMDDDASGRLFLSLSDGRRDGTFVSRLSAQLSVVGYHEHVKPLVEACD